MAMVHKSHGLSSWMAQPEVHNIYKPSLAPRFFGAKVPKTFLDPSLDFSLNMGSQMLGAQAKSDN